MASRAGNVERALAVRCYSLMLQLESEWVNERYER